MRLQVETVLTLDAGLSPSRLVLGGRVLAVDVVDRWPGEGYTYFKVGAEDGNTYILRHDDGDDAWDLTLFRDAELDPALLERRARPNGPH